MSADTYSNKDPNKNHRIDVKESKIQTIIIIVTVLILCGLGLFYYYNTHSINTIKKPISQEPPAIVGNQSHPYDTNTPPYKQ